MTRSKGTLRSNHADGQWLEYFRTPSFSRPVGKLVEAVETVKVKKPNEYQKNANTKLLAAIIKPVFESILADPTATTYRQGSTLVDEYRHWFRAKFGSGRFRLFFRYDTRSKVIIFAWVNDKNTLRTYGSRSDAYKVFKGMLDDGNPPDDWDALYKAASGSGSDEWLTKISSARS